MEGGHGAFMSVWADSHDEAEIHRKRKGRKAASAEAEGIHRHIPLPIKTNTASPGGGENSASIHMIKINQCVSYFLV